MIQMMKRMPGRADEDSAKSWSARTARDALGRRVLGGDVAISVKFIAGEEPMGDILTHLRTLYAYIDALERRIAALEKAKP